MGKPWRLFCPFYSSMLWDLFGEMAGQVYRSWSTYVKLAWKLPRATHNYLVANLLSEGFISVREKILAQYVGFLRRLATSISPEIRMLSCIVAQDVRSPTGKNCLNLRNEFNPDPWLSSPSILKSKYSQYEVPETDKWRLPLLTTLL